MIVIVTFVIVVASEIAMRATEHREYSSVWESHARISRRVGPCVVPAVSVQLHEQPVGALAGFDRCR